MFCGNASSLIQTITVNDTTPPVITSIPGGVAVSCASDVPAANDAAVVASRDLPGARSQAGQCRPVETAE